MNAATLRAVEELDLAWVLGRTGAEVPSGIDFLESAHPYDQILLSEGADPPGAFDRIREQTHPGAALRSHPNMLEYYDALSEFEAWIADATPVPVGALFGDGGDGVG